MMTKSTFLTTYRAELLARFPWAQDTAKLDRFMMGCRDTLIGCGRIWQHEGDAVTAAWRAIGGKGKPTLKALRALA